MNVMTGCERVAIGGANAHFQCFGPLIDSTDVTQPQQTQQQS